MSVGLVTVMLTKSVIISFIIRYRKKSNSAEEDLVV